MDISISFLGGIGEIGMNMYLYETKDCAIIIDCGIKFANISDLSVDQIIPDFSYLETIKDKLKAVIITHAHEDHTGALQFLLADYDLTVAASRMSMALIDSRLKEYKLSPNKIYLNENESAQIGDFNISFIPISHSIHGTGAVLIECADGFSALHVSDYKIDFAPVAADAFRLKPLLDIYKKGLTCLLSDSTNCLVPGFTKGELCVYEALDKVFSSTGGRIFFTSFASNTERLQTVFTLAEKYGRKIAVEGASLTRNIAASRLCGFLKINDDIMIPRKSIERLPDNEVCVILTGCQAEPLSVMARLVKGDYSNIKIRGTDLFIFSSRTIPGNELNIVYIINKIAENGATTLTAADYNVHVSGHASKEDALLLLKLLKPEYLIPVHGEYMHLKAHKSAALSIGMDDENIIITSIGERVKFSDGVLVSRDTVPAGKRFIDSRSGEILTNDELLKRRKLSAEGAVFLTLRIDMVKGKMLSLPSFGVAGFELEKDKMNEFRYYIYDESEREVFERFTNEGWIDCMHRLTKRFFKKRLSRYPVIIITIGEFDEFIG